MTKEEIDNAQPAKTVLLPITKILDAVLSKKDHEL